MSHQVEVATRDISDASDFTPSRPMVPGGQDEIVTVRPDATVGTKQR
jgi:hypothetical protein